MNDAPPPSPRHPSQDCQQPSRGQVARLVTVLILLALWTGFLVWQAFGQG